MPVLNDVTENEQLVPEHCDTATGCDAIVGGRITVNNVVLEVVLGVQAPFIIQRYLLLFKPVVFEIFKVSLFAFE